MSLITFAYGVNILVVLLSVIGLALGQVRRSIGMTSLIRASLAIAFLICMQWVLASWPG